MSGSTGGSSSKRIDVDLWLQIMKNTLRVLDANSDYLNFLDSQIGDGEHGLSMIRGFRSVNDTLAAVAWADSATLLKRTGAILMETVGGAAGPLYGSFYSKGATSVSGKAALDARDMATFLRAGLEGVQKISGGTQVGEKTMVDAIAPAVSALESSLDNAHQELVVALSDAVGAARRGMENTIGLRAKKGRASYLGERSEGHQDPGATSMYFVLRTILDTVADRPCVKVLRYEDSGLISAESALDS